MPSFLENAILRHMQVDEAIKKAFQVLREEEFRPTMKYGASHDDLIINTMGLMTLITDRKNRPRAVLEDPTKCVLQGTNFELLMTIFAQVSDTDRPQFISRLLDGVRNPIPALKNGSSWFPSYDGYGSALSMIAEFCVRTGYLKELLDATKKPTMPTRSLIVMLMQLEEMIAANFNLFSETELETVPDELATLREIAERQTYSSRGSRRGPMVKNLHYRAGHQPEGNEIVNIIDGIQRECVQARYWYLKGALQNRPNLEIENDRLKVESYLSKLGFGEDMVKVLNAAEQSYKEAGTSFELKSCFGHLRSFLEHLHRLTAKAVADASGVPSAKDNWGAATLYLRQNGLFTLQHENFIASLYTLMSDTSIHPLGADREYARLLRNMVIEYGVMFLSILDNRGVKI